MAASDAGKKDVQELQMLEQALQNILMQKQNFQLQVTEADSAMRELEGHEKAFKIVGSLLVESDAKTLTQDLASKKDIAQLRLKALEKQEAKLKEKAGELQKSIMSSMKE